MYHTPTGYTSTSTTFTSLQTAPHSHLLIPDWLASTSATHLHWCQCRVSDTSHKLIFPSFFTLTRFFSPRLSAMSSIYDKGTGCERVPHWATRLCRWALCLAAPFPASRGSIPLCQAFIANAVAPRGPALRGTRIPETSCTTTTTTITTTTTTNNNNNQAAAVQPQSTLVSVAQAPATTGPTSAAAPSATPNVSLLSHLLIIHPKWIRLYMCVCIRVCMSVHA